MLHISVSLPRNDTVYFTDDRQLYPGSSTLLSPHLIDFGGVGVRSAVACFFFSRQIRSHIAQGDLELLTFL